MRESSGLMLVAALLLGPAILPAQAARPTSDGEINKASEAVREHPTEAAWSRLGDALDAKNAGDHGPA